MRPIIGITSNFGSNREQPPRLQSYLLAGFADGVFAAGGLAQPVPVPPEHDDRLLDEILDCYYGLLFTGGFDLDSKSYGARPHPRTHALHPRRERFELDLFRRADARRIPILGICLGHQLAHVARGGALLQHVDDLDLSPAVVHHFSDEENAFHDVAIAAGSRLADLIGVAQLEVNSRHHQTIDPARVGAGLTTVATSADGVVEASEDCDGRFLLTVQWHPEDLLDRREHLALFRGLVDEAGLARGAR
jgi:putative glutamine amidotransferase